MSETVKEAVILAAGRGTRLESMTGGSAKCLAEVGGRALIDHQIAGLRALGVDRIVVVVGHAADAVRRAAGPDCVFVENERYAETNSLYSLWLAREAVTGPFVLMNCDVLAHADVLRRLVARSGNALAFDSRSGDDPEQMKVEVAEGTLRAISKTLPRHRTRGENVGILRFDAEGADALFRHAGALVEAGEETTWAPAAVGRLARTHRVRCVDVSDLDWVEIDFPEDLDHARRIVWPAIRREPTPRRAVAVPETAARRAG